MVKRYSLLLALAAALPACAQTDITKYYLKNYGFDADYDYPASSSAVVKQEIKSISNWTPNFSIDYTITGIYEFGFKGTYNGASIPSTGYDGEGGGCLALSTGWEQDFSLYQTVTLPAGTYTIIVPTYNGKSVSGGKSLLAWIPNKGTQVSSTVTSYPSKKWTVDKIQFTLKSVTTGKIQIGYKAAANGSANSANLAIDYVQLLGENMTASKTSLNYYITQAKKEYGDGSGDNADKLKEAIDAASTVSANSSATMPEILEATYNLKEAIDEYLNDNASEEHPSDYTKYIQNPSFETMNSDGSNTPAGWTLSNMAAQSNSVFAKSGTYYMENWVNIGSKVGNAYIKQTLSNLPAGNYKLSAKALNIQQTGSNSTANSGSAQTGAYIYAGNAKTAITSMGTYSVSFAVLDEKNEVEIGMLADGATGNYLCVDNFTLSYTGKVNTKSYVTDLQNLLKNSEELAAGTLQESAASALNSAVSTARKALEGTGKNSDGNTTYDLAALKEAHTALKTANENAAASHALYASLEKRIDYANQVLAWWKDDTRKANAVNLLTTAVADAKASAQDRTLTDAQLKAAVTTLNTNISRVDKRIYCSGNACGSDSQLQNDANQWSYNRSIQSKHWILFWEKGYGDLAPSAVPTILDNADKIFEFYANDLKFITINKGTSKTDTYKMIIRLRYTTDWEASGSGIDNTIGLLTLSRNAYTSRSGQTVGHEIGHCFQYQTHCDNNNQNGWMYTWANSANGNVFWEMCAQWQAYKFYPSMQFNNEWFNNTLNGLHKNPLSEELRYNNYFIQDFFCHKQGTDMIGRLWNESRSPEDPFQAYMRLTMKSTLTAKEKLEQFNNEMWEYGARMTTFDMDGIRDAGKGKIGARSQTGLTKGTDNDWYSQAADCVESFGNNAIRLNVPSTAKTVYAEFSGEAGKDGFIDYRKQYAGWKLGFVALKRDGTRIYGDISTATNDDPDAIASFECPAGCSYLWLVVSGAPTLYWSRGWNGTTADDEQWPYHVKFYQTNVYGNTNNTGIPTGIKDVTTDSSSATTPIYNILGQKVAYDGSALESLPKGTYIIGGKKYVKQ